MSTNDVTTVGSFNDCRRQRHHDELIDNGVRDRDPSSSATLDTSTVRPNRDATNAPVTDASNKSRYPIMQLLVQHVGGGDSSSRQSLQAPGPHSELSQERLSF